MPDIKNREAIPDGEEALITFKVRRRGDTLNIDGYGSFFGLGLATKISEGVLLIDHATKIEVIERPIEAGDLIKQIIPTSKSEYVYRVEHIMSNGDWCCVCVKGNRTGTRIAYRINQRYYKRYYGDV